MHRGFGATLIVSCILAACGRGNNTADSSVSVVAITTRSVSSSVIVDSSPFTPPKRPTAGQPDLSELIVMIEPVAYDSIAPAELLLTDPERRRVGAEAGTWRGVLEIPGATYDSMPPLTQRDGDREPGGLNKQVYLVTPSAGHYALQVLGRRDGSYSLSVKLITPRAVSREARVNGTIRRGETQTFRFTHEDRSGPLVLRQ